MASLRKYEKTLTQNFNKPYFDIFFNNYKKNLKNKIFQLSKIILKHYPSIMHHTILILFLKNGIPIENCINKIKQLAYHIRLQIYIYKVNKQLAKLYDRHNQDFYCLVHKDIVYA